MFNKKPLNFFNLVYFLSIFSVESIGINNPLCTNGPKKFLSTAEQNAVYLCPGLPPSCTGNLRYYSSDGSCNNLEHPRWGQTSTGYVRIVPAAYSDGISKLRKSSNGTPLPNSRLITTTIFTDKNIDSNEYNIIFYGFAQWVDHDMGLSVPQIAPVSCCDGTKPKRNPPDALCVPITPPPTDYYYSKFGVTCIDVKRIINTATLACPIAPVHQINLQTSWLDLSTLYSPAKITSLALRSFRGGHLRVGPKQTSGQNFPSVIPFGCPVGGLTPTPGGSCIITGDLRVLQNPELFVTDITMFRLHNHVADGLSKVNPTWNDETLFQEARKILIAKYQHVVYNELIPALIGRQLASENNLLPEPHGYDTRYNVNVNGQTISSFVAGAGRVLHSLIRGSVSFRNSFGQLETYRTRDKYFNQNFILKGNTFTNLIKAYVDTECGAQDQHMTEEITNHLFISETQIFGQDLISIDINRGRDFGLPPYNEFRKACGLCPIKSFQELEHVISNPKNIPLLESLYKNIEDVDFYVLGTLEKPVPGGIVGPTVACILAETYRRAKFGDRLFYEFPTSGFTSAQLEDIKKTTFSQFLCLTNNITTIQSQSFRVPSLTNPFVSCSSLGDINFSLFKSL